MYGGKFSIMFEFIGSCITCDNGPDGIIRFYTGMAHCPSKFAGIQRCLLAAKR